MHDQTCRKQNGWSCGGSCVGWFQWWIRALFSLRHAFWRQVIDFMSVELIDCLNHSCYTLGRIAQSVVTKASLWCPQSKLCSGWRSNHCGRHGGLCHFHQSGLLYTKRSSPFRMTIYHMLLVRQVLWRVLLYTRPNLPQAEWLVIRGLLCWLIPMMDTCIFFIEACLLTSSYWFLCLLNLSTVWITAVTHLAE